MCNAKNFSWFQFLAFSILIWLNFDFTKASPDDSSTINKTNPDSENQLNEQLFQFAQTFSVECLKSNHGNVILSPLSVSIALNLLLQATNGTTFDELHSAMHLSDNKLSLAKKFPNYLHLLHSNVGNHSKLSIANQIFVQNHYQLKENFQMIVAQQFQSGIESVNFADSKTAANIINRFVTEKTNGKIHDFIAPDQLDATTRTVLVNAIHFKGQWHRQFEKSKTIRGDFYINDTESMPVDFMVAKDYFNSANLIAINAQALELNYANSNYSFVILLPDNRTGLADLESKLKYVNLAHVTSQMIYDELEIKIPKFNIEFELNLNEALKHLGINKVFTPDADLSGLLNSNDPLYVSDVIHKAFIEVNEEGSEAGAATGIGAVYYSLNFQQEFRADHPFVYYIRERNTNTIVFSGRFQQPN